MDPKDERDGKDKENQGHRVDGLRKGGRLWGGVLRDSYFAVPSSFMAAGLAISMRLRLPMPSWRTTSYSGGLV